MIEELEERLRRYPPERYPVQHATARFHLGVELANAGRAGEAAEALAGAARLFDPDRLPIEHAKALNALGAALRLLGRRDEAVGVLADAAAAFARAGLRQEQGAAAFNLGLVRRELGDEEAAAESFRLARELLGVPAAVRELGASLLALGALDEAAAALDEAVATADGAELGAAWNTLGLVRLAAGDAAEAATAFRGAAGAHPRTVRPHDHAMAKANLALAYECLGEPERARLAARQALGVPGTPEPVAAQAEAVLDRLGSPAGDLVRVLEREPEERRLAVVRDEVARWLDVGEDESAALVDAGFAEAWLGALLELPPAEMETLIGRAAPAIDAAGRARVASAMARFHAPQLLRLRESFERMAGGSWS